MIKKARGDTLEEITTVAQLKSCVSMHLGEAKQSNQHSM
jgi:hypothetical protein